MCGIAGILSFNNNPAVLNSLPNILDAIKHRGPDDEGYAFFTAEGFSTNYGNDTPENVKNSTLPYAPRKNQTILPQDAFLGLGHRRLSIIDLSEHGHQPMCDDHQQYWIVYNGEIYNYESIKKELSSLGHQFISSTDTEILLKAYIEWGKDCLDRLNGMWSFVIFDSAKNELFAARDRFGVKPLYYTINDEVFAFASEIKALLKTPNFKRKINTKAAFDYLYMGKCEADEESFFKGVYELKPGHTLQLSLDSNKITIHPYYTLKINHKWEAFDKLKLADKSDELFEKVYRAVELRLKADVKVGTCLSGGIDSSIIASIVNKILTTNNTQELQELFTAVYPNSAVDEDKWAELIANSTQSHWNKTAPSANELKSQLEDLIYYQDIPFTSTSSFSQYKVMELVASTDVKTTLDGQGADELFGGYEPHFISSLYNSLIALSFGTYRENKRLGKPINMIGALLKHCLLKFSKKLYKRKLLKSQKTLQFVHDNLWKKHSDRITLRTQDFSTNLNKRLATDFNGLTLKHILRLADRNSMRFSIESRMPFADDHELIEQIFLISGSYKIREGKTKYLLRNAFKHLVPSEIINRNDKIGFATPQSEWLRELKPYFKSIIFEQENDEFINWKGIQADFEAIYNQAIQSDSQRLWRLINFALWRKCYKV